MKKVFLCVAFDKVDGSVSEDKVHVIVAETESAARDMFVSCMSDEEEFRLGITKGQVEVVVRPF